VDDRRRRLGRREPARRDDRARAAIDRLRQQKLEPPYLVAAVHGAREIVALGEDAIAESVTRDARDGRRHVGDRKKRRRAEPRQLGEEERLAGHGSSSVS